MAVQRPDAHYLVDAERLANSFDFGLAQRAQFEVALDQTACFLADDDTACRRCPLHPRREVGHMSNRRVLGVPSRVDHAQNYFARVDPDTDLDSRPALLFKLLAATAKRVAHRDRRVQCALRMILVSDRRAEQRENPITGRLYYVAV